jgi:hypothetical protein
MKYGIYSVRDKLSGYMNISLERGDAIATRSFTTLVNTPDTILFANPSDYDLYKVGEFDSESGTIESCVPSFICSVPLAKSEGPQPERQNRHYSNEQHQQ